MNLFAIFAIGNGSTFKIVHTRFSVKILDYLLMRNISLTIVSLILINALEVDWRKLPKDKSRKEWIYLMIVRSLGGHVCFLLFQYSFLFAPVSVLMAIFQINTFITSTMAYLINGEVLQRFELIGMLLCFMALCVLSWALKGRQASGVEQGGLGTSELFGVVMMTLSAIAFSVQCVFTRKLKDLHFTQLSATHAVVGLCTSAIIALI